MGLLDQLKDELDRIICGNSPHIWTTKDGKRIPIEKMTNNHLRNTLRMLMRKAQQVCMKTKSMNPATDWRKVAMHPKMHGGKFKNLEEEANKRGLDWLNPIEPIDLH